MISFGRISLIVSFSGGELDVGADKPKYKM
jgi:hypothetical protein